MSKHRTHGTIQRRLLSGLLCLALVLGLLPAGTVLPAQAANWADPYGQQLVDWGVMRGDISGNLNLGNPITRAEFVTMINRAFGYTQMGSMPFTDVPSSQWYAEDINIAYNAGYFKGMSTTIAAPNAKLTREQAAVLLARNLMLQETTGESLGFSDSRTLQEWSRGLIGAAVAEGVITGYSDNSFRPANNITRGEVAAMLVRAIGTPVNTPGTSSLGNVYGNVLVSSSNVTLRDTTIAGNLYLAGGIGLGSVLLQNVTVLGRIVISGGGESNASQSSVVLRNVVADEMVVDSIMDHFVTIRAQGVTDIPLTSVRSDAYLDDSSWPGYGLTSIELDGEPGVLLQLAGSIKEVVNLSPSSEIQLVQGSAETVTIDEYATNSRLVVGTGTRIDELNLDVATLVTGDSTGGKGDIGSLNIGSANCKVDILPDTVTIRPGLTAEVDGEILNSTTAAELSAEPRLLAGYPTVDSIAPTTAEGLFSGNKSGTIYWAVSNLADGSVSEEDLIKNPVYGGNIFADQAGEISASNAKTEYGREIKDLVSDGSYYLSAILVDARGKHSPVKVMAFTTPDDTKPGFATDPEMTKITTAIAQVTAMPNKSCQLYWALLPAGATAPTPQQLKGNNVGGNYGYGTISVAKNVPISITVNKTTLLEKTDYDLYLWLTDYDGAQSMDAPLKISFTTPDETPPIVSDVQQVAPYAANTANATFSMNEAPATLYWAIVAEGNTTFITPGADDEENAAIMSDLRNKIKVESGSGAVSAGSSSVATAFANIQFTISGLDTEKTGTNNYTLYFIGKDAAGNYSETIGTASIRTLDTTPPTVDLQFTVYNGDNTGEPLADSGIKLVFSEQVKGGANAAETFLALYASVLKAQNADKNADDGNESAVNRAKNVLAKELSDHIQLWSVPRNGRPTQVTPRSDDDSNNNITTDWIIDFHNAVVTQESNGDVVVFLPGESDVDTMDDMAIQMDSGASYYFYLKEVFDDAIVPNGISTDPYGTEKPKENPSGNLTMRTFTTVYAQITMARNADIGEITYDSKTIRADLCFDLIPTSTEKVPDSEHWDLIIWSDTSLTFQLYRQKDGDTDWELVNVPTYDPARIAVTGAQASSAIGMGASIQGNGNNDNTYAVLPDTLVQDETYHYALHFTSVNGTTEEDEAETPQRWSDLVTMEFSLIAGSKGNVQDVSISPNRNYDLYIGRGDVTTIGTAHTTTGTSNVLTLTKQFTDIKVPEFITGYPQFTAGSGTINMKLNLDRAGTIYYVVAPAGDISTSLPGGTTFIRTKTATNDGNDGAAIDADVSITTDAQKKAALNTLKNTYGLTYIPTDGEDRDTYRDYIAFTNKDSTGADKTALVYESPTYLQVINPNFGSEANVYAGDPVDFKGSAVSIDIPGLMPETTYYIYFVRQGGGQPDEVVEIYRVTTTEVNVPSISVTGTSTTATMVPSEDCNLSFALVELNNLPTEIFGNPNTAGSVIDRLIQGVFDGEYDQAAGTGSTDKEKEDVLSYVLGNSVPGTGTAPVGTWSLFGGKTYGDKTYDNAISANTAVGWGFENEMTAANAEYVVLAVGRHPYGGETAKDYGYGAVRALFTQDKEPPVLDVVNGKTGTYLVASVYAVDADGNRVGEEWKNNPTGYSYSGTVEISFDKDIYFLDGSNVRYAIYYSLPTTPNTTGENRITLSNLLSSNTHVKANTTSTTKVGNSFTLTLDKINPMETITIFTSGRVCNGSSYTANQIRLVFDPQITTYDLGWAVVEAAATMVGGFRVTMS